MGKGIYIPLKVKLAKIIEETPVIKTFVLQPEEELSFKTGQFVELTYPGKGEAPFTPSSDPNRKDEFEITIMRVGRSTSFFHQADIGDEWGARGPYGKGYPIEEFKGKDILIVGGGVGLAPLRSLIFTLFSSLEDFGEIVICYGARTPQDIVYKYQIKEWERKNKVYLRLTVDKADESWKGNVGVVTTLLNDLPIGVEKTVGVVCGPPIMMKFTTLKLLDLGFSAERIYLSMEKNMSCGLGKCGHCRLGKYYVCKDGPVFKYEEIKDIEGIWD